jgi:hypothetical protein
VDPRHQRALVRGAVAGAAAAIPQAVVGKAEELLLLPPREDSNIAPRLVDRLEAKLTGRHPSDAGKWLLGTAFHFGYGAGWGALYAAATHRRGVPPLLGGALLGGLIYGITFPRWGGAVLTDVERAPGRRTRRMTFVASSVTLTFGLATAGIFAWLSRRDGVGPPPAASRGSTRGRSAAAGSGPAAG